MRKLLVVFLFAASLAVAQADQKISEAQQSLKDQGYFYGDVNGEKNTETTDAVRRYQIRNGLSVTGDLDDQTLAAIRKTGTAEESAHGCARAECRECPQACSADRQCSKSRPGRRGTGTATARCCAGRSASARWSLRWAAGRRRKRRVRAHALRNRATGDAAKSDHGRAANAFRAWPVQVSGGWSVQPKPGVFPSGLSSAGRLASDGTSRFGNARSP